MDTGLPNCESCGKPLRGRSDKRFCNDYCRHLYHNKRRSTNEKNIKKINGALKRNRQILKELLVPPTDPIKIKREDLLERGFVFRYHTHHKKSRSGSDFVYCYEYGYLPLADEQYLIVKEEG
jgi:hypothetical protein